MNTNTYFYLRANQLAFHGLRDLGLWRIVKLYFKSKSIWFYLSLVTIFAMFALVCGYLFIHL